MHKYNLAEKLVWGEITPKYKPTTKIISGLGSVSLLISSKLWCWVLSNSNLIEPRIVLFSYIKNFPSICSYCPYSNAFPNSQQFLPYSWPLTNITFTWYVTLLWCDSSGSLKCIWMWQSGFIIIWARYTFSMVISLVGVYVSMGQSIECPLLFLQCPPYFPTFLFVFSQDDSFNSAHWIATHFKV